MLSAGKWKAGRFKRFFPCRLFVFLLSLLYSSPSFAQLATSPWPMFMHDTQHTGQSTQSGPPQNTLSWKYQTGSEVLASLVLGTDGTIYVGSVDGNFHAISPSGVKKWSYTTDGEIYATAAVDYNNVIYVGSEDGFLYAISKGGTLLWRYGASGGISSSPVINPQDGSLYFGTEDAKLYALETTGSLKWSSSLDEEIWASPAISNNVLYIATLGGIVYALDASSGAKKWSYDTQQDSITGSPVIDENSKTLFVGTESGIMYALNTNDGTVKWTYTTGAEIMSTPAIDTETDSNALYLGAGDGNLYALDISTGKLKWKYKTEGAIFSSPAIDKNGIIYFGSSDSRIYSINKKGTKQWSYTTKGEVYSSPSIDSSERLFIGSFDGYIYAIGKKNTALTADFTATPTAGDVPLTVQFTDQSVGEITSWQWDFGDDSTDATQSPAHTYNTSGTFTVSLTVTGSDKSNTKTMENYISVTRKTSAITLNISATEITFGQSLTLAGQVYPAIQGNITLTFTNLDEDEIETETVTSGADGSFILSDYFPHEGGSWNVVAVWDGNSEYNSVQSSALSFVVNRAELLEITIEPSSPAIQIDQTVDVSGAIRLTPDNEVTQNALLEEELKLIRIAPDGTYEDVIQASPYLSEGQIYYQFENVNLPVLGTWELMVGFDEEDSFTGINSAVVPVEVLDIPKDVAGYAILVEGRAKDKSGLDSHNVTANYVYKKLVERGFADDEIYYFNYDDTQEGVDETPSKDGVLDAIKTWASNLLNKSPAPLYIVFIGHGDKKKFFLHPDTLKTDDLSGAVNILESNLNSAAAEENILIVIGANHSGSFINSLSQTGKKRIIITSSDSEEIAYKGPLPPNETIRHGDYFIHNFFMYAARGLSLKKSYENAAELISEFTENENGNGLNGSSAGNGQYFDDSAQHPLLDDNGDGIGTNGTLSSLSGKDGALSSDITLGIGDSAASLEITESTEIITLEASDDTPTLFAKVNDVTLVDEMWVEIISPDHSLENKKNITEQQIVNLPGFSYNEFDAAENKYLWNDFSNNKNFNNFKKTGEYEIFHFAQNTDGEIAPFVESDLFRNAANNQPPASFTFVSPANGTETTVALTFDWEDSVDTDTGSSTVTYTFQVSENVNFDPIYFQIKGLTDSLAVVDKTAGLRDGTTYYWRVLAIDGSGGVTSIGTDTGTNTATVVQDAVSHYKTSYSSNISGTSSSFKPKLANGYPGFIKGFIFDEKTNEKLAQATVSAGGTKNSYTTTDSGAYFLQLNSGTYTVTVSASGYDAVDTTVRVSALNTTTENIGLTVAIEPAGISGKITDKKKRTPLEGVTITVKKKDVSESTTTDSNGSYSITDLESGKYTFTAKKSGYKSYKTKVKLKAGQEKTVNCKLQKGK